MAAGYRFEASFGGVRIDVTSTSVQHGRKVFPHGFPKRDGAENEDQGRRQLLITLEFIFIDRKPQRGEVDPVGDFQERFEIFDALVDDGPVRTLVHPYLGQILCKIADFTSNGDGEGQPVITASATFMEEIQDEPIVTILAGSTTIIGGAQEVKQAAVAADEAAKTIGFKSTIIGEDGDAVSAAESWAQDATLTTREVQTEMAEINGRLNDELATIEAAANVNAIPLIQAYTLLQYRLRKSAEAFSSTTPRIIEITTEEVIPLRMIAAGFYGAEEADRRFLELLELNPGLRSPACVPAALTLKAYSRTVRPREFRQQ